MTFFFLFVIIGATRKARAGRLRRHPDRPGLTLIHLVSIPVTNTSVNPARSTGPALFAGGGYIGAALAVLAARRSSARVIAGLIYRWLLQPEPVTVGGARRPV